MPHSEPLTTYLELRESTPEGVAGAGLSHKPGGMFLLHVLELAAHGEPRGGVTILHDAGDHGARSLELAQVLAESRWAVALPDLRGHGRSEGARGDSAGMVEVVHDVDAVQQHLAYRLPIAPKALIGQGLGALYALHYALEHPLAALVLLAPTWSPRFALPEPTGLFKRFRKLAPTDEGRIGNDPALLTSDPEQQRARREDALVHDVITVRAAAQALDLAQSLPSRVRELETPVLCMRGERDELSDAQTTRGLASERVEVRVVPAARHDLLHERGARELALEIRDWLDARVR